GAARETRRAAAVGAARRPGGAGPAGGKAEAGARRVAARLDDDLVVVPAGGGIRERQLAERLLEFAKKRPLAEDLLGRDRCRLDGGLRAHEEQPLPFALGFVHVRLDLHEIEDDRTLGI